MTPRVRRCKRRGKNDERRDDFGHLWKTPSQHQHGGRETRMRMTNSADIENGLNIGTDWIQVGQSKTQPGRVQPIRTARETKKNQQLTKSMSHSPSRRTQEERDPSWVDNQQPVAVVFSVVTPSVPPSPISPPVVWSVRKGRPYDSLSLNPHNQRKYGRIFEYGLRCSTGQTNGKIEADTVRGRSKKVSRHGGECVVDDHDSKPVEFSVPRTCERMWDVIQGPTRRDLDRLYIHPWKPSDLRGFVLAPKVLVMRLANVCHRVVFTLSLMMTSSNCNLGPDCSPSRVR